MAVPKRKSEYLGLKNLDVLPIPQEDVAGYFRILECPDVLTQGKSSFLIAGSSNLKPGVDIKIELIHDDTDEVIYVEPIMGHLEGDARRVSIEVYDDVTPGPYTLYVVSELNPENVDVPQDWLNIYNVRYRKSITINGMGVNTQTILFHKSPSLKVREIFKEFVEVPSGSSTTVTLLGDGVPRVGISSEVPTQTATVGGFGIATYPDKDFKDKAKDATIEENKPLTKLSGKSGAIGSKGKLVKTMSPVMDDYYINLSGSSTIDSYYVGEPIRINNPQIDTSKFTLESYHSTPTFYTSSVMNVLNSKTFVPRDIFYVNDNRTSPPTLVPAPLLVSAITASHVSLPTQTTSSINFFSFADITVSDMKTFSGDVHKVKIYAKSEGSLGDFELIYDSPIESTQILYDKNEVTLNTNIGYFLDVARINKYWEIHQEDNGIGSTGTLAFDSTYKVDSMKISGSNLEYEDSVRVQHKTPVDFIKGNLYSFSANLYGIKTNKKTDTGTVESAGEFFVFLSGSAFDKDTSDGNHWGVEKLNVPDFPDGVSEYDFGKVEGSFLADKTATGTLQFKVPSGVWHISDIKIKAATDTAFNPDFVTVTAPVPPLLQRPDRMRFMVEFYDVNNNIADTTVFTQPIDFTGPNINISGTDNILSGSMYIGSALESGVEMAGVNSAFIRSMGYQGFKSASNAEGINSGFMMFSGSVLPDSGDEYAGVGLELVGNSGSYFKFRTNPSELDVRANAFFVGNEATQFISGSDGNVEISSSNFHLTNTGDVNMSGTITATAGNIGNWKIIDGMLSGSNATLDADGAALYHSTKGPGTDSAAAFDVTRDEYYIDFTPEEGDTATAGKYYVKFGPNFSVSASGVLFASGAVFEGQITASTGQIGGAQIESTSLAYSDFWRISSSAVETDPVSFISSSKFKVSAGGNVTGSQVLFTGGKIGGFTIDTDEIKSGTTLVLDADSNSGEIKLGAATDINTGDGIYMNGTGDAFRVGNPAGNEFKFDGTSVIIGNDGAEHIKVDGTSLLFIENSTTMAELRGTTWTLGGAHGATDDAIVMSPDNGVTIFDDSNNKAVVNSSGLTITQGGTDVASFGAISRVGDVANEHISMSTAGMTIKDGTTVLANFAADVTIGEVASNKRNVFIDENVGIKIRNNTTDIASFGDDITLVGGTLTLQSNTAGGGNDDRVVIGNANIEMYTNDSKVVDVVDGKISIGPAADAGVSNGAVIGNIHLASGGAFIYGAATNDFVNVKSDAVDVVTAGVTVAKFGAITTIGDTANEHISASSAGIHIHDGATVVGSFKATGAIIGDTAGAHISASTLDVSIISDSNNFAKLDADSLDITVGGNQVATFGANPIITGGTVTIRNHTNNNDKVVISENKMEIFDNNNAVATFAANTVIEGGTVTIQNTTNANDKVVLSENKLEIFDNNVAVAEFAATTTIGNTSNEHVSISGSGLELKDGSAQRFAVNSSGLAIGDNFNVDTSGNVSMSGVISAAAGQLATFTITSGSIDSDTGNAKRGLKLVPGDSIRGYGSEAHKTTSTGGKFSFGTGAIAPSATAGVAYDRNIAAPDLPGTG